MTNRLSAPASELMGAQAPIFDSAAGLTIMDFVAPVSFASPRGFVQRGLIGGFLDEVMGAAVYHKSDEQLLPLNLDTNISCLSPVPIGPLKGKGSVIRMGRKVAFLEGELFDETGKLLARATSTAILTEVPDGKV